MTDTTINKDEDLFATIYNDPDLSRPQQVAKRLLSVIGDFRLNMELYKGKSDCGTTYCLLGYLAHVDNYPERYLKRVFWKDDPIFLYEDYKNDLIARNYKRFDTFLFHGHWNSGLDLAKARCQYVLDHNDTPPDEEWVKYGWEGVTL